MAFICDQHNDAACVMCKHRKHRKCKTNCVSIQGDKNKDNKRNAVTRDKLKNVRLPPKTVNHRRRKASHLSSPLKDQLGLKSGHRRNSKRIDRRRMIERPNIDMKNNATVFADEPEQNVFGSYNIQTPTGSMVSKQVRFVRTVNIHCNWVTSICFMPNGCPVVIEFSNETLKLLDADTFEIKGLTKLCGALADVAVIGENSVITTLCFYKRLQFVQIFPDVLPGKVIQLENECYGVDVYEDEIFVVVTATWLMSGGVIKVLDLNGNIRRSIEISPEIHFLTWPRSLKINKSDGTIFVSDLFDSTFLSLTREGDVLFKYTRQKKKRNSKIFLLSFPFNAKMPIVIKY